jgi:hypothetical protein
MAGLILPPTRAARNVYAGADTAEDLIDRVCGALVPEDNEAFRQAAEAALASSVQCWGPGSIYRTVMPLWRRRPGALWSPTTAGAARAAPARRGEPWLTRRRRSCSRGASAWRSPKCCRAPLQRQREKIGLGDRRL